MAFSDSFTNCDTPLAVHNKLLTIICCDYLDTEFCRQHFTRFMMNCRVHLNTPRERSLSNALDICDALESKGLLGIGDYHILREMVADVDVDLIDLIQKAKEKIEVIGTSDDPKCKRRKVGQEPIMDDHLPDNHVKHLLEVLRMMNFKTSQRIQVSPLVKGGKVLPVDQIFAPVVLRNDMKSQKTWQDRKGNSSSSRNLLNCPHDIFYNNKEQARYVLLLGEAGRGKTVFCQQLLRHWCAADEKGDNDELSDWEKVMREFDYVFLVSLRHVEDTRTCVQDMICQDTFKSHKECHDAIRHVLSSDRYRCLVIIDGLDEWKISPDVGSKLTFDGVPNIDSTSRCTFLFTFRPWKFDVVVGMLCGDDNVIEICGITEYGIELTIKNMLLKYYGMDSSTENFRNLKREMLKKAKDAKMKSVVKIPLLLTATIQLWYEKKQATSMTSFYAAMVQLLIKRTINAKPVVKDAFDKLGESASTQYEELPELLQCKTYKLIRNFISVLITLGKLAYEDLVSQETHLVFSKDELDDKIGKDNLEFFLAVGLLSQCEAPGCFDEENISVNFFHKTMQEFLAAFFISVSRDVSAEFSSRHLSNMKEILELSNVIMFLCGLSLHYGQILLDQIMKVTESDPGIASWRRTFSWEHRYKTMLVFRLLKSCHEEMTHTKTKTNNLQSLFYYVPDVFVDDSSEESVLSDTAEALALTKQGLVSLFMSTQNIPSYHSKAERDLAYILTNGKPLSYVCLRGYGRTLYSIDDDISIKTLILDKVNLMRQFIHGLANSLEKQRGLQFLSLTWIRCKNSAITDKDRELERFYESQMVKTSHEKKLHHPLLQASLSNIFCALPKCLSLTTFKINYRSLSTEEEKLSFLQMLPEMSMLQELHYLGSTDHNYDVDDLDECSDVHARRPRNDKFDVEVSTILSKMTKLRHLHLSYVSFEENMFQLSKNMSEIEHIGLSEVYMASESWCKFIESMKQLNHRFHVKLSCTGISRHEKLLDIIHTCPLFTPGRDSIGGSIMINRLIDHIEFDHAKANV